MNNHPEGALLIPGVRVHPASQVSPRSAGARCFAVVVDMGFRHRNTLPGAHRYTVQECDATAAK